MTEWLKIIVSCLLSITITRKKWETVEVTDMLQFKYNLPDMWYAPSQCAYWFCWLSGSLVPFSSTQKGYNLWLVLLSLVYFSWCTDREWLSRVVDRSFSPATAREIWSQTWDILHAELVLCCWTSSPASPDLTWWVRTVSACSGDSKLAVTKTLGLWEE